MSFVSMSVGAGLKPPTSSDHSSVACSDMLLQLRALTYAARDAARANLSDMAKSLHRDPQLESLLQNRRAQLGLDVMSTKTLSQDLQLSLGRGRGMGIGM